MPFHTSDGHWIGSPLPPDVPEAKVDRDNRAAMNAAEASIRTNAPLTLVGPVGVGKTSLLASIARGLWINDTCDGTWSPSKSDRVGQIRRDAPFFFTTADAFVRDVRASYGRKFEGPPHLEQFYTAHGVASQCRRLFLDDLGIEEDTSHNTQILVALLHERDARKLPTWITTNLTRADFEPRYGKRMWDRLRSANHLVEMLGESRRAKA